MTMLAYDPARIDALHDRMLHTVHGLWFLGCGDPFAVEATAAIADARRQLGDLWIPLLEDIKASTAMTLLTTYRFESDDLEDAVLQQLTATYGWAVVNDLHLAHPATGVLTAPPSIDEVTALAMVLQRDGHGRLTDTDEERTWLTGQLTMIATDPLLAAAFAAGFTAWTPLIDRLGTQHLSTSFERTMSTDPQLTAADDATIASIDHLDAGLATVFAAAHGPGALPDLDHIQPYAAAELVAHAQLTPDRLAAVSFEILGRVVDQRPLVGWDDEQQPGPKTGDLLFGALLATPGSTTPFVLAAAADPERLWWTANDPTLAQRVAATGTDPAVIDTAQARDVITSFVGYVRGQHDYRYRINDTSSPSESNAFLGDLIAPWLLQFSPVGSEWVSAPADIAQRSDLLRSVLSNDDALDRLLAAQQAIEAGLVTSSRRTPRTLDAYAGVVGLLTQLVFDQRVGDEQRRKELWDRVWSVADLAITVGFAVTDVPPVGGTLVKGTLDQTYAYVSARGWFNAPTPEQVAAREEYWQQRTIVATTAVMVRVTYDRMVSSGRLAADTPPPPDPDLGTEHPEVDYGSRYATWRDEQLAGVEPGEIDELDAVRGTFLSPTEVGRAAAG